MANVTENQVASMRNQLMVSSMTGQNRVRLGHFIEPSFSSHELSPNFPPQAFTNNTSNQNEQIFLKAKFIGWQTACQKWEDWVTRMHPDHESTWKMAGIYDAIMSSTIQINQDDDVVLALARKWFPETNTFVSKWQEHSVTLEDVCVLGGYSVSGESVSYPLDTTTQNIIREVDERLTAARRVINKTSFKKVTHNEWARLFTTQNGNGFSDVEHEAFLVFWLSKFVFPKKAYVVGKHVHSLAIRLSRGTRIALAPAVLASLYRDLTTMKNVFSAPFSATLTNLVICSPMHLVQVWAWERFGLTKPNITVRGQQIMARWQEVNPEKINNIVNFTETCGFRFRPYASIFKFHAMTRNMYPDNERWVLDCSALDLEADVEAFIRFIRPSELVGLDCIEQYLPHRVARQFGFDQDIPCQVARFNQSENVAWAHYTRPFNDMRLYIPPKSVQTEVTSRYLEWWNRSRSALEAGAER